MKRLNFTLLVCCILTLAVISSASAQWADNEKSRLGVSLGFYLPQDSILKGQVGRVWLGPILNINTRFDEQDRPISMVEIGIMGEDDNSGIDGSFAPVTFTYIKRYGESQSHWYTGAGVGAYFTKLSAGPSKVTHTKIGINLRGGREFGRGLYTEMRYDLLHEGDSSVDFSGLVISAGLRQTF
jgi:hypothetical protein